MTFFLRSSSHRLCSRCTSIDFNELIIQSSTKESERRDYPLGPTSSWAVDSCDFCQFLLRAVEPSHRANVSRHDAFKLTSIYLSETFFGVIARSLPHEAIRENSFAIESSWPDSNRQKARIMCVLLEGKERLSRNPTFPMVDFAMVSGWLTSEKSPEGSIPTPSKNKLQASPPLPFRSQSRVSHKSSELARLRVLSHERARKSILDLKLIVIDCTTRRLTTLPVTEEYVTLSYVWGRPSGQIKRGTTRRPDTVLGSRRLNGTDTPTGGDRSASMPPKLPRTIEDSITVCNSLQYRYLWIDRYCIPQEDPVTYMEQIHRMDDIYFASALTLIACAGTGPQHGLPGVSRPRSACPAFGLDGSRCFQIMPTVQDLHASMWASRAWTYQEGLLAQRRLFFTDRQVYFESNDMVDSEFTTRNDILTRVLDPRICSQVTSPTFSGGIHACIEEYTFRKLTFPSDIMNALSGILNYYAREHHISHLWGIPFSNNTPSSINEPPRKRIITFEESLRWYPRGFQARRQGFPSWSWSGWYGSITWRGWRSDLRPTSAPFEQGTVHVEVETTSGQTLGWTEYQYQYADLNDNTGQEGRSADVEQLEPYIHVGAFASPIVSRNDISQENAKLDWNDFVLDTADGKTTLSLLSFSNPLQDMEMVSQSLTHQPGDLLAVHFPGWQDTSQEASASILVIKRRGDLWERIALLDDDMGVLQHAERTWMRIRLG